jgi:hypothetical protein
MYIPITTAALLLLTVAMILLQIFWLRLPPRLRAFFIGASIAVMLLHALIVVTKWSTTSNHLNVLINWLAIAGYELVVLLFSRLSPRWLTIPCSVILLIPLLAASVIFPLAHLFEPGSYSRVRLSDHLFYEVNPWANAGGGNAGVDIIIYYRPSYAPFLRRKRQTIFFNDQECNSYAAFAIVGPAEKTVVGRCPRWPPGSARDNGSARAGIGTIDKLLPLH